MDGSEEGQQRNCGRYIFREADLAYLLIDGEKMFPLAELLASLFSNTARTTLFTRMEKIDTRRHFCSAEEIKLLKTVNGIHGSSAICTLIPEADVQKYCDVYIDRTVDVRLFSTTIRRSKSAKDSSKIKASKQDKGITKTSNSIAKTSEGKSPSITNVESDKDSKSLKGKKAAIGKLKFNNKGKAKVPWEVKTSHTSNHTALHLECLESIKTSEHTNSLTVRLAEHVLKGTQTVQTDRRGVKARKKRKAKDCPEDKDTHGNNKKTKRCVKHKESESFPCRPWEHCTSKARSDVNDRTRVGSCTENLEHPCGSSLSQCLTNANTEILFSDASSNDSGFASTTISESQLRKTSTCLDTNRRKKPRNLTVILPSPSKPDKSKKLNKTRVEHDDDKQRNKNLSPPALVLKRQNNRWQVETKSEQDQHSYNTATNKAKKRLKWSLCNETEDGQLKNQGATAKKKAKKKRKRVSAVDKNESVKGGIYHQEIDVDVLSRKIKRKRLDKDGSCKGDLEVIHPHVVNNSLVKVHNARKTVKRGKKSKHVPTSNIQNTKKIAFAKTLKVNKDFKFMRLFSSFPLLSVKDGELCPIVSGILSKNAEKPPPSHPIWKWQQGGPVFVSESRKTYTR